MAYMACEAEIRNMRRFVFASPEWRKPWASLATQYLLNKVVRDHDGKDEEAKVLQKKTVVGQSD
jgi:hypothetical protein